MKRDTAAGAREGCGGPTKIASRGSRRRRVISLSRCGVACRSAQHQGAAPRYTRGPARWPRNRRTAVGEWYGRCFGSVRASHQSSLLLHRPDQRQLGASAPVLEGPVIQTGLVACITRRQIKQAGLLPDVAVRDDAVARLDAGIGEELCDRLARLEHSLLIDHRRERDVAGARDMSGPRLTAALAVVEVRRAGIENLHTRLVEVRVHEVAVHDDRRAHTWRELAALRCRGRLRAHGEPALLPSIESAIQHGDAVAEPEV